MRVGKSVVYVKGKAHRAAVVLAVTGSGASGYKTLDLDVDGRTLKDVPHELDESGRGHWTTGDAHAVSVNEDGTALTPAVPGPKRSGRATAGVEGSGA